jgi:ABC-type transport system involved in cytochrome bd biosynthesis fused ATPase/permease subunit
MSLPNGYNFVVSERGASMSLGQRQLLSFLRVYLAKPQILILDEATSSIDDESEKLIQQATEKITQNRTSIIIAHRLSTIEKADKIIVMDKGKIVEIGKHQDLLQQKGYYAKLYQAQLKAKPQIKRLNKFAYHFFCKTNIFFTIGYQMHISLFVYSILHNLLLIPLEHLQIAPK